MSDGREEREEQEKRRQLEEQRDQEDRIPSSYPYQLPDYEPERRDS